MSPQQIKNLYNTQISITEWFKGIGYKNINEFKQEDNTKRDRLAVLNQVIGLPYDRPIKFLAEDVVKPTDEFKAFVKNHGSELCAMRLIPLTPSLPKLRMRGLTVKEVVKGWFPEQKIDAEKYQVEFIHHPQKHNWSTIFVVNQHGIFGEIIDKVHSHLTQQSDSNSQPISFCYDFTAWRLSPENNAAENHLKKLVEYIKVADHDQQDFLVGELKAEFHHDFLAGYFETVDSEFGLEFIDYNRVLGNLFSDFQMDNSTAVKIACPGKCTGKVKVALDWRGCQFSDGDVLICDMTTPDYLPLMKKAGAIITQRGGLLSHAAITARELGKPCLVGYEQATKMFKDGDLVEVDADRGRVRKIV